MKEIVGLEKWDWLAVAEVVPLPLEFQPRVQPTTSQFCQPVIAVVGYGYWGQKLAAALTKQGATVVPVDPNQPGTRPWSEVLADPSIQGVVIATPEKTHAALALAALKNGKAVLVEKPAATTVADWQAVAQLALQQELPVLVDYTFLLSRAAQVWRQWQTQFAADLGDLQSLDSVRLAHLTPARIQAKAAPVWLDAAIHDLYLVRWLWAVQPSDWQVTATTIWPVTAGAGSQPVAATVTAELQPLVTSAPVVPIPFTAQYSWVAETPQRVWRATYQGGAVSWERRGANDWLQAITTEGKVLAEASFADVDPSPLDRTIELFLAWVGTSKSWAPSMRSQWQKYWATVEQDIVQLAAIK